MKCFAPKMMHQAASSRPGTVVSADSQKGLIVAASDQLVEIQEIQMPGKRRMKAKDYLRGNAIEIGEVLS